MKPAEEMLKYLTGQIEDAAAAREHQIAKTREYWNSKPRTMLNDTLSRIEMEKHYAHFTLYTAEIRMQREKLIDALCQVGMQNPYVILPQTETTK